MEYLKNDGTKIIVDGNKVKFGSLPMEEKTIGANFVHGARYGGSLSSFNGSFSNELIGIENGFAIIETRIGDIEDAYQLLKSKISKFDDIDFLELSGVIIETVDEYFGGISNIDKRGSYYKDYDDVDYYNNDNKISNLKGSGAGMCVERAALAQNLLTSLGIESYYKSSSIIKNGNKEVHSYNLVKNNSDYYVFDTSIPNMINGKANPLIAKISSDVYDKISNPLADVGISVAVSHYNPYRNEDVEIVYDAGRKELVEVNPLTENDFELERNNLK
ncbi:MAG: hypothetical protein IJ715_03420 [Bacilli bacterium]|nr:hypothetical protein [Bacilli bacterium]MBR1936100.1 hypothetical protein [Bacilli bacterium]